MNVIPVLKPDIDEQTIQELNDVLRSGWWGFGPKTIEFEKKFAEKVGAKYAVGINSGTTALDLCLKAYGIKDGELITSPMTFLSDAIVSFWNNMSLSFCDIEEDSLCLDPNVLHLTKDTKAIIVVDSHGRIPDYKGIRAKIAEFNKTIKNPITPLIIEDAAHAMLSDGAGKGGDITIWSFQAVKTLPIGDGGMITTNDEEIYEKIRSLTWLGIRKSTYERTEGKAYSWNYDVLSLEGIKAYLNDICAVIGLGQLRRIDELTARRRAIQSVYNEAFRDIKQIKLPMFSATCQYYTMQCERRDELSDFLASKNIASSVHFKPITEMTAYKPYKKYPLPITDRVWPKLLSLPVFYTLTPIQQEYIIQYVKEFYA